MSLIHTPLDTKSIEDRVIKLLAARYAKQGLEFSRPVTRDTGLFEGENSLDLDSLLALELVSDVEQMYDLDLSGTLDFDAIRSIGDFVDAIAVEYGKARAS